ncbi:hypothetical protein NIES4071_08290 [Calothrix sp. NIES-4071]|nr:hypothetical protein NIES4071_08290 [Calothrix sp. NIES-4071]BAZ55171.1 hypothetical protein NIES4105_08250 [Calothrix sp. NIES-4105]
MKYSKLPQIIGASILSLSIIVAPLTQPASAQVIVEREGIYEDNDFNWGWLGLIGLVGLAGLAGKKQETTTAYQEPNRPGYRE